MAHYPQILLLAFGLFGANYVQALDGESIIGGAVTTHHERPYQVRIFGLTNTTMESCGGAIVDDYHIISAAHCFLDPEKIKWQQRAFIVVAGVDEFTETIDNSKWITATVKKVFIPKVYENDLRNFVTPPKGDLAVVRLDRPLNLTENTRLHAATFPWDHSDYPLEGERAIVSGYGVSGFDKIEIAGMKAMEPKIDGKLRYANTTVLSTSDCQEKWNHYTDAHRGEREKITEKHLCALVDQRDSSNPEGICSGDSGGPLVTKYEVLIGVVSAGPADPPCEENNAPGIYTRVSAFEDFIKNALKSDDSETISFEPRLV